MSQNKKQKTKRVMKIIDWIALVIAIFVVVGIVYKITGGNIDPSSVRSKKEPITYQLKVYAEEASMLEHIRVGDQISEAKRDFNLFVKQVEMLPKESMKVIIDEIKADHISDKQCVAIVTISGEIDLKGESNKLGKQEISPGNLIFLESRLYKLSAVVLKVER